MSKRANNQQANKQTKCLRLVRITFQCYNLSVVVAAVAAVVAVSAVAVVAVAASVAVVAVAVVAVAVAVAVVAAAVVVAVIVVYNNYSRQSFSKGCKMKKNTTTGDYQPSANS